MEKETEITETAESGGHAKPLVSIVIPAYNEESNLYELRERLTRTVDQLKGYDFEFLLIDNCSEDGTGLLGQEFASVDNRWKYIRFSRNFGAEASLAAGIHYAEGDALILLFSDLQEPPEEIPTMIEKWREGYEVVYGVVSQRSDDNFLKTLGARLAYKFIFLLSDVKIPPNAGDYKLISRPVIEALKLCGERNRYLRGLVHWVGFRQCGFNYERVPRKGGKTTTDMKFLLNFAVTALVAFTNKPLRWAVFMGIFTTILSMLGIVVYVALKILSENGLISQTPPPPGWTTMTLLIFFFGGLQCLFVGIIGEYIAKVYVEVKRRPIWVVHKTSGFEKQKDPLKRK